MLLAYPCFWVLWKREWDPLSLLECGMSVMVVLSMVTAGIVLGSYLMSTKFGVNVPVASVVFDVACKVVHVSMSPWKYYIDAAEASRAVRILRLWFGALAVLCVWICRISERAMIKYWPSFNPVAHGITFFK